MTEKAKIVTPKYKKDDEVILKNTWAMQLSQEEGLKAKITAVRIGKNGEVIYSIDALRPPVPMSVLEDDLTPKV